MTKTICCLSLILSAGALCACDSKPSAPSGGASTAPSQPAAPSAPAQNTGASGPVETTGSFEAMGLVFPLPTGWSSVPPSNSMRMAEIRVPDAGGESVIAVSSAGGSIEGNISRWAGQVRRAEGAPAPAEPTRLVADGVPVTVVEFEGTYLGMGDGAPQDSWMMRGAIVETAQGLLFLKMTGPVEPMRRAGPGFMHMVSNMKKR